MAVSGASFLKPLLSYLTIVSLREARECIVLINSKTLVDSPVVSRRSLHSKKQTERRKTSLIHRYFHRIKLFSEASSIQEIHKLIMEYFELLHKVSTVFSWILSDSISSVAIRSSGPAFRWTLFSMVRLISCFRLHHPSLNSLLSDAEEVSVGDLTGTASTEAEAGFEILLGGCRIRIRTVKRVLTYHCRRKDMFEYVRMISREQQGKNHQTIIVRKYNNTPKTKVTKFSFTASST